MHAVQSNTIDVGQRELSLAGSSSYRIDNNRILINIDEIANLRGSDNVSGTLAVELWALKQPYQGAGFAGVALAGTQIGEILGQHFLGDCRYDLVFREPPAGKWHLVLMLREWSEDGFITRDYVNFALPYEVEAKATVVRNDGDNVINVSFARNAPQAKETGKAAAANMTTTRAPQPPPAPAVTKAPSRADAAAAKGPSDKAVSLNQSEMHDIAAVKGISKKLAEMIVAERPYESMDEVLRVKGMGAKLLEKVRKYLTL